MDISMIPLHGHDSIETAYIVNDYPYGGLRCRIRFWLEQDSKKGFRFCSQTEHPKKMIWNAPKKSTYCLLAGAMFLNDEGHCRWEGLTEYSGVTAVQGFVQKYPGVASSRLERWCREKARFNTMRAEGKAKFTINGVVKEDSQFETDQNRAEARQWLESAELICDSVKSLLK